MAVGTTALVIWQGDDAVTVIADTIPAPAWAAVNAHMQAHRDADRAAMTFVACQAAECPVAAFWQPDVGHKTASGL